MNVAATNAATTNPAGPLSGETGDMFLKLLTTQLKSQDPLSPMDPTQFVGQLVQFNTLNQLVQIRQLIESGLAPATTPLADNVTGGQ